MKNYIVALGAIVAMLSASSAFAEKHKSRHHHKSSKSSSSSDSCCKSIKKQLKRLRPKEPCCKAESICQKTINKAGGRLVLYKSGNYTLCEDVVGTLIVAADSVCIDLCCHTLSAGGALSAIIATGHEALEVFNGRI